MRVPFFSLANAYPIFRVIYKQTLSRNRLFLQCPRIPASEMESLQSFVSFSGGEILKDTQTRKRRHQETAAEDWDETQVAASDCSINAVNYCF